MKTSSLLSSCLHARCATIRHLTFAALLATVFSFGGMAFSQDVRVADHGAIVNDGTCDAVAIRAAIQAASLLQNPVLIFEAGVYNLKEESIADVNGALAMMHIHNQNGMTLRGAVTFTVTPGDSFNAVQATISPAEGANRIFSRIEAVSP